MRLIKSALLPSMLLGLAAAQAHAQLNIVPTFDASITNDSAHAAAIEATINQTISIYRATFSNPTTVNITFAEMSSGLGQSSTYGGDIPYSTFATLLHNNEAGQSFLQSVPLTTNNPVNGSASIGVTTAQARTLGFNGFGSVPYDSMISINTGITNISRTGPQNSSDYDLQSVLSHEIDEALGGFGSSLNGLSNGAASPTADISSTDLYRYDASGNRSFTTSASAASYFSVNGGQTDIARFNQTAGGDFSDFYSYYGGQTPEVQDAFGTPGSHPDLGNAEKMGLLSGGYDLVAAPEPSQTAALGIGLLGLTGLALRARRRRVA